MFHDIRDFFDSLRASTKAMLICFPFLENKTILATI